MAELRSIYCYNDDETCDGFTCVLKQKSSVFTCVLKQEMSNFTCVLKQLFNKMFGNSKIVSTFAAKTICVSASTSGNGR